jgi:lipopolysaccharide transport system ATP-binding protein
MTRREVKNKFDEIVAFSEVERFLDTPVKRYSSGMYVRLAFAVAAHLEPEILLVDEVLAVGDAAFQKKCLGKMGDVARGGRTVFFVSHNLSALRNLCPRALLLHEGRALADGASADVVARYIDMGRDTKGEALWVDPGAAPGNEKVRLHAVRIRSNGEVSGDVDIDKELRVELLYWNLKPGSNLSASIHLMDNMGVAVLSSANMPSANLAEDGWFGRPHPEGLFKTTCVLPANFLNEGTYSVNAIVLTDVRNIEVWEREAVSFTVHDTGEMRKEYTGHWIGVVRPKLEWHTELVEGPGRDAAEEGAQ